MRGRAVNAQFRSRRAAFRAAALCAGIFALLTCTPPDFTPPPEETDPLAISPKKPEIIAGSYLAFTAAGGTPEYVFSIASGTGEIDGSTGLFKAPPLPGTTTIRLTDRGGSGQYVETQVTVKPGPLLLSPGDRSLFTGETLLFTVSGGTPPYTGSVNNGEILEGTNPSPDPSWYFTPETANDYVVSVTDSATPTAKTASATIHVTVRPAGLSISPSILTLLVGETFTFTAAGGTEPYVFTLQGGAVNTISASGLYQAVSPTLNGKPDQVLLTDGNNDTRGASVTVTAPPIQISPTFLNLPYNAGFDFEASGGKPPYTFWIHEDLEPPSGTLVPSTGVFSALQSAGIVKVMVTDSLSSPPSQAVINVFAPLDVTPKPATAFAGVPLVLTPAGGIPDAGRYTFSISAVTGDGSIDTTFGTTTTFTASSAPGSATITVTDSIGYTTQAIVTVVDPAIWSASQEVDAGSAGTFASLALVAGSDWPVVAYYQSTKVSDHRLKLARWNGAAFSVETVDSGGDYPGKYASLALDSNGYPHISHYYSRSSKASIGFAEFNGSTWVNTSLKDLVSGAIGTFTSLALDPNDSYHPRIAFYDNLNGDLAYLARTSTGWQGPIEKPPFSDDVGQYASLRLTPTGSPRYPHLAYYDYYDSSKGHLRYAWQDSLGWHYDPPVDAAGNVGQYASLQLDTLGVSHIAYYDATNGDLKYTWKELGVWHLPVVVDGTGDVGKFASLALTTDGKPRIAYYDATNSSLKYASWNGSVWVTATIDNNGDVGQYASLALDANGKMRIAYYDAAGKLKYIAEQ